MNFFATLITFVVLAFQVQAVAITKRIYTPTSPVFSLLAIPKGNISESDILTFNGSAIKIGSQDSPFFGRIDAQQNYSLNIPFTNNTNKTSPITVQIDEDYKLAVSEANSTNVTTGFGIVNGYLTYANSTGFIVCPDALNATVNGTSGFSVYANPKNSTSCPSGEGVDVKLLAELVISYSYTPSTNTGFFKRQLSSTGVNAVKRVTAAAEDAVYEENSLSRFFKKFF
ncbi:hypothetical protein SBY92_004500 [Candida maltosa Xu316]|uniref:Cell wall protein n=1 Tax=Candida maltosa (strain Xu316) TaxID=1245528 RepID=M3HQ71_CANMX|nr:hypothetical protein G210_5593 [Candida maltosa Xu316]